MTFARRIMAGRGAASRWLRLRHAFPDPWSMLRALRLPPTAGTDAALDDRIVVIGVGWASLTFVRELTQAGYRNITIVTRDDLYGGKCVNFGCMPTEFILSRRDDPIDERRQALGEFVAALRSDVAAQFAGMGWPIVHGTVTDIAGSTVRLDDGTAIPFDRLAIATGSHYPIAAPVAPDLPTLVSIEDFWSLPPAARVVIHAQDNLAAISLGAVAKALGLVPTVLLSKNRLGALPSMRHLVRRVTGAGVAIFQSARLLRVDATTVTFSEGGKTTVRAYDHLLCAGRPAPALLPIDGRLPTVYDLDFATASLPSRPDIVFLGDSAGYFTAGEAESQARMVARAWSTGTPLDLDALAALPVSLEGPEPLCMAGAPWTLAGTDWAEIDFRSIGWSKVHQHDGKLWYLFDRVTGMVEAIHICHANAKELIAAARLLMAFPVDDVRWRSVTVHPSSAEIFRMVADHAAQRLPRPAALPAKTPLYVSFHVPEVEDLSPGGALPPWLSPEDACAALTSARPRRALAASFAIAKLTELLEKSSAGAVIADDGDHRLSASLGTVAVSVTY